MSRGRRFEVVGFGMYLGGVAFGYLPHVVWVAGVLGFILGGCWLQFREEKRAKREQEAQAA